MVAGMRLSTLTRFADPGWLAVLAVPALAAVSGGAAAHHSFAAYDMERTVTVDGTIESYEWQNPHVELTVRDAEGVLWLIETDAPATMTRSRWSRDTFAPGDPVSVRLNPNRDVAVTTGLLLTVRGANWVSRGSVARTGGPTTASATAIMAFAALVALWVLLGARKHRTHGTAAAALAGFGILVWTVQFAYSGIGLAAGVALLVAGAIGAGRAAATKPAADS